LKIISAKSMICCENIAMIKPVMTIGVTGSKGFIGSYLSQRLMAGRETFDCSSEYRLRYGPPLVELIRSDLNSGRLWPDCGGNLDLPRTPTRR
jgi:hypothetical protein